MHGLGWPIAFLVIIVGAAFAAKVLLGQKGKADGSPYQREPGLFTPSELAFLRVLEQALGSDFRVMGKVRLADVLKVRPGISGPEWQRAFNRLQSKHLDFVVCAADDLSIQFVVELDDSSHGRTDRRNRDIFVDKAMAATGLPIIHFPVKQTYAVNEVRETIATHLNATASSSAPSGTPPATPPAVPASPAVTEARRCPACGGDMVLRKATRGQNAGNEFWGCSNYPKCRGGNAR